MLCRTEFRFLKMFSPYVKKERFSKFAAKVLKYFNSHNTESKYLLRNDKKFNIKLKIDACVRYHMLSARLSLPQT